MKFIAAVVPSMGVLFLFYLAIRAMVQADRSERLAQARAMTAGPIGPPVMDHPVGTDSAVVGTDPTGPGRIVAEPPVELVAGSDPNDPPARAAGGGNTGEPVDEATG